MDSSSLTTQQQSDYASLKIVLDILKISSISFYQIPNRRTFILPFRI